MQGRRRLYHNESASVDSLGSCLFCVDNRQVKVIIIRSRQMLLLLLGYALQRAGKCNHLRRYSTLDDPEDRAAFPQGLKRSSLSRHLSLAPMGLVMCARAS